MLSVVADETARVELRGDLDGLAREGARRMLAAALEAEVEDCLAAYAADRDERGWRLVVRNGHARASGHHRGRWYPGPRAAGG